MTYRHKQTYFRKPLEYSMFHILLVKTGRIWTIDCSSWSEAVIIQAEREEKRINPANQVKHITSPSDDETVIQRLVKEMNRYA